MDDIVTKIIRMYKAGSSVLEIYRIIRDKNKWKTIKIAEEIAKSEITIVIDRYEHYEKYLIIPSKMNYTFKTNKYGNEIQNNKRKVENR